MRYGVIAVAVVSLLSGLTAPRSYGDTAYGVGNFMGFDALSGICSLDTATSKANMLVHTPGVSWYGATDGPSADTFYAVANPSYGPAIGSELYLIDTTTWTYGSVFIEAPTGGGPIREIGWDESTSTLYGTDYANLYTIPTAGGLATFVGTFGTHPGTTDWIDYVFSMDYDPGVGQLVGTSWRRGADQTDLYYFDRTNGAGTLVGYTGVDRFSDVWYSNQSATLLGASRLRTMPGAAPTPGRSFNVNATTGAATPIGPIPDVSFYGLANATPPSGEPPAYVSAPLTNLGYETYAYADVETRVDITGVGNPPESNDLSDPVAGSNVNASSTVDFNVPATVQDPQSPAVPWQNTNAHVTIDLSTSLSIPDGMLRASSSMVGTATGSDEGVANVTRDSGLFGTARITGVFRVEAPAGLNLGMPAVLGIGVYTWGDGISPTWDLTIEDATNPAILSVNFTEATNDTGMFTVDVFTGQPIAYSLIYSGFMDRQSDGTYDLFADIDFGAVVQTPEPATILLLSTGAVSLILKKRRRRTRL